MRWLLAVLSIVLFSIFKYEVFGSQRILGGQDAMPGEFPWVAAIWTEGLYFCGGSLLSPFYVLTAAHCTDGYAYFYVIMGAHNLYEETEPRRQVRNTTRAIIHEDFDSKTLKNDIALLRLTMPFFLTPWVRTIRLQPFHQKDNTFDLQTSTLTGWGLKGDDARDLSTNLQKLDLKVISNKYCSTLFPSDVIGNIHLCTNTTKKQTPCRGDSGGALTVIDVDGRRTQIGIDSFSWGSCSDGYPEVYSRVSYFLPWIQSKTKSLINGFY